VGDRGGVDVVEEGGEEMEGPEGIEVVGDEKGGEKVGVGGEERGEGWSVGGERDEGEE
jgi:hypothetical protein